MNNLEKLYPKIYEDKWWKKFTFQYWNKHFTMRFSWKPMILLEKFFIYFWWDKKDFSLLWEIASWEKTNNSNIDYKNLEILKKSMNRLDELHDVINLCKEDEKSPFVLYVNDFNPYK